MQVLGIAIEPDTHHELRLAIADHIKKLPKDIKQTAIDVYFNGKSRAITDFIYNQKKDRKWIDDKALVVHSTAYYLNRSIYIYSFPTNDDGKCGITKVEPPGTEELPRICLFRANYHYQSLRPAGGGNTV